MISEPEDYGLSAEQTLEHVLATAGPAEFESFWAQMRAAITSLPRPYVRGLADQTNDAAARDAADVGSALRASTVADADVDADVRAGVRVDAGRISEVRIASYRAVDITAQLIMPSCAVRGGVVWLHGDDAPDVFDEFDAPELVEQGFAVLRPRVRGYPPSTDVLGDLRGAWITQHIGQADSWVVAGAVVDVVRSYHLLRSVLGAGVPITMHGESLGGGLAVIASAQLEQLGDRPARLSLVLPSLGAWRWRAGKYCNGMGGRVMTLVDALRGIDQEQLLDSLVLFDAALHARHVRGEVLCRLALRDDVVPAPSAAAIYNALGSASRWRCVTRYGHFDGGIAHAREVAEHARLARRFLAAEYPLEPAAVDGLLDACGAIA